MLTPPGKLMPKILLVEDSPEIQEMLSSRLKARGYDVVCASNGKEGVEQASAEKPDAILMDLSLPIMDGWAAIAHMKGAADTQAIPIIALTAHAMAGDEARALQAGADAYRTKPVDFPRLLTTLHELISGAAGSP